MRTYLEQYGLYTVVVIKKIGQTAKIGRATNECQIPISFFTSFHAEVKLTNMWKLYLFLVTFIALVELA